jgi:hypothetical protein
MVSVQGTMEMKTSILPGNDLVLGSRCSNVSVDNTIEITGKIGI